MTPIWINPDPWRPLHAPLQGTPPRILAKYLAVVHQFEVESAKRYQPTFNSKTQSATTFCNIFCWDVTTAMGCEVPHWFNKETGAKVPFGKGSEMRANDMVVWLRRELDSWRSVPRDVAEVRASIGYPTIIAWENHSGPGHVAMVLGKDVLAQAGGQNFMGKSFLSGFGKVERLEVATFHTHD